MKSEYGHRILLVGMSLMGLVLLTACTHQDDDGDKPIQLVKTQFNFSLPLKHAKLMGRTRMEGDVVQKDGTQEEFREMTDVRLLCFNTSSVPSQSASKIGNIIEIKTDGSDVNDDVTEEDYSLCQEITIPVTTSYFGFYARAKDAPVTHEDKMKYGVIETVGLGKTSYQDNSSVRFRPVPICTSENSFGGSAIGPRLLDLLNDLMSTSVAGDAPNDKWATTENLYLNEAYQRMTELKALSSEHVQIMLAAINRMVNYQPPYPYDNPATELAAAISAKIASCCTEAPAADAEIIELKEEYLGFPDDLHLPAGSARVEWDADQGKFVVPDAHSYGTTIHVASLNHYVYPMNLQYQIFSDILASDNLVIQSDENPGTVANQYDDWDDLINNGYTGAAKSVQQTTQSVAMVKQVEYAVGRMSLKTRLASSENIYDAKNQLVDVENGFTLKGYVIGGQREVDYNFQPVADSKTYAIYDSYLNGGTQSVKRHVWTDPDYILGLGTDSNQKINLALELVNDGDDFQGADGVIAHGATFYLVAELDPTQDMTTELNKIFDRDYATQVNLTIKSLANATYGLPDLDIPHPTVGVSVNLAWEEGLWYDDIEL